MGIWDFVRFFVLYGALASGAPGCASTNGLRTALIERLVDKQSAANALHPNVPLDSRFIQADEVQSFIADHPFERRNSAEHYTLQVSVAPAGRFLDPVQYEARRATFQQAGAEMHAEFPAIGLRAQREFFGAGPGGASYGLTFTTRDGQYDVRISVSALLPEGVTEPNLDLEAFARDIEARYDSQFAKPTSGAQGKEPLDSNKLKEASP